MCTKSKTTWGCGCSIKDEEPIPCDKAKRRRSRCADYERYLFKRDGDCRNCRNSSDPIGRGIRGEGRYAQEIKRERRRENAREAYDDSFDRGINPQPRERAGGARANSSATSDDGPEEITYEYRWDSPPSPHSRRRRSIVRDEDVDDVIDLTPPKSESRDRRRRDRRSSFPSDYGSPARRGRPEYEYYQDKEPPRYEKRHRGHRDSLISEGADPRLDFVGRMRDHCRASPKEGRRRARYEYRESQGDGDLDDFAVEYEFDNHDDDSDYDRPRLRSARMGSGFPMSSGGRDPFKSSFFSSRLDDFYDDTSRF